MIKRWEIIHGLILSEEEGSYVEYTDYQNLETEIAALKEKSDKFEETIAGLNNALEALKESNDSLRAQSCALTQVKE